MATLAIPDKLERGAQLQREGVVIRTWDLRKTYVMGKVAVEALRGVDLEVPKGEFLSIVVFIVAATGSMDTERSKSISPVSRSPVSRSPFRPAGQTP